MQFSWAVAGAALVLTVSPLSSFAIELPNASSPVGVNFETLGDAPAVLMNEAQLHQVRGSALAALGTGITETFQKTEGTTAQNTGDIVVVGSKVKEVVKE